MKKDTKVFSVRLEEALLNALERWSKKENRPRNNLIETVLKREARKAGWLK